MDNKNDIIYCTRCGLEMNAKARYCMKCGNLNYDHPDNLNMKERLEKKNVTSYEVGAGKFILGNNNNVAKSIANNTGNKLLAFLVTYGIYLILVLFVLFLNLNSCNFEYIKIISTPFPILIIIISLIFIFIYAIELMFMKANERWWAGLIPIYNVMILSEVVFNNKKLGLIVLIPGIGLIYLLFLFYKLGEKFKCNGFLTALLFFVMIPVIGYSSKAFDGRTFVETSVLNATEREYKLRNIFLFTTMMLLLSGVCMTIYSNLATVKRSSQDIDNYYYVYSANKIVKNVRNSLEKGAIECDQEASVNNNGVYYIHYVDASNEFRLPFRLFRDPIESYVKIVNVDGQIQYYISLTDGKKGFSETLIDSVMIDKIEKYEILDTVYEDGIYCQIMG